MRIIFVILFVLLIGCGGLSPTTPSDEISLCQVGPYKYDDAYRMWEFCSHPESKPSRDLCGICHWIY